MSRAYDHGANRLWVFNVGDIKPAELELQFAMDMAWDVEKWRPRNASYYTKTWAKEIFGDENASSIAATGSLAFSGHFGTVVSDLFWIDCRRGGRRYYKRSQRERRR